MRVMEILYNTAIVSTGLFAGLMMTLVFLLQKQWTTLDKEQWFYTFKTFLVAAKGHPLITVLTFAGFIPAWWLGFLELTSNAVSSALFFASGTIFFVGCFLVTVALNLPIYDKVISWNSPVDASEWRSVQKRFFTLNLIRLISSLIAFILLLVV